MGFSTQVLQFLSHSAQFFSLVKYLPIGQLEHSVTFGPVQFAHGNVQFLHSLPSR